MLRIAPSILSADFGHLADQVQAAEAGGADYIHIDVMDGLFVPNITMGPLVVEAVRRATRLPLDVHLMIQAPERYLEAFVAAGASILTIHAEACTHLQQALARIRALGARAGLALCPATPLAVVEEVHEDLDLLLVMTVNPGFGGQRLIPATVGKVRRARALLERLAAPVELEVDGGINPETAPAVVAAGAETLVAGSAVFSAPGSVAENIAALRAAAERAALQHCRAG
ncbi:MAG TPA: ribulose-phosphate 3-epimerase [Chloroflexota bacterium]|nr:ribulose-phosphate 3-epimerase [Chloroflexota bacterium]